jgi:hypothetical protein
MDWTTTIGEVMARLERQVAFHREQAQQHARQEAYFRERKDHHAQEADEAERHLEAFRGISGPALQRAGVALPEAAVPDLGPRPGLTRLVETVLRHLDPVQPFGLSRVLAELEKRFGEGLRKRPQPRHVSMVLQRLAEKRAIHRVRRGRPYREALYVREKPAEG